MMQQRRSGRSHGALVTDQREDSDGQCRKAD